LATITAYLASVVALIWPQLGWDCFFDEPVMILGFILLGRTLERQARGRASAALHKLLSLQPATVHWLPEPGNLQKRLEIPVEMVQVGAKLQVFAGEKFPVDGEICQGQTLVDESMLTGEAMPINKPPGAEVIGGTLNQTSPVVMVATRTGNDTALAQIIQLVESAQIRKAPIQQFADWVAGYFTYGVISLALLTFGFWLLWGSHWFPALSQLSLGSAMAEMPGHVHNNIRSGDIAINPVLVSLKFAIAVLVVACPCALGLATPTAILVGTSLGAEQGLLIRGGDVLERVHKLDTIVFDKTGTLTTGIMTVQTTWLSATAPSGYTQNQVLQLAASLEQGIKHPLALGIVAAATQANLPLLPVTDPQVMPGFGVRGQIQNQQVLVGSAAWLGQLGISGLSAETEQAMSLGQQGMSLTYLAVANQLVGGMALSDPLRPEAADTLHQLQQLGLRVRVLTGDQPHVAATILAPLGLGTDQISAQLRPQDKAAVIEHLQAQGHRVGMVGDGINDAPALAQADVGLALASGTDVAMETAQIVLMRSYLSGNIQLTDVVTALRLGKRTFAKIQQNLVWASGYNLIALPMAMGVFVPLWGIHLGPSMAGAMMAASSVLVVVNSLLLRRSNSPS
jgi:P-type Cu2+ transporter